MEDPAASVIGGPITVPAHARGVHCRSEGRYSMTSPMRPKSGSADAMCAMPASRAATTTSESSTSSPESRRTSADRRSAPDSSGRIAIPISGMRSTCSWRLERPTSLQMSQVSCSTLRPVKAVRQGPVYRLTWRLAPPLGPRPGPLPGMSPLETSLTHSEPLPL
jgi:hypothetical protein